MGLNYFIFDGESSLDYGVYIGGQGTYNAPQRDIKKVSIPGRNGDLIMDNGRYLNAEVSYNIIVMDNFRHKTDAIRAWLSKPITYARLEDTYHPDEFRMGMLTGGVIFETGAFNKTGKATITFDCKPERFLKSGEIPIVIKDDEELSGKIINPTKYPCKPLIRVNLKAGQTTGTVTIGNQAIVISGASGYVDIDSALMDCYKGAVNCNSQITLGSDGFPIFEPGETGISYSSTIDSITITGRWWTL